jgi:hypothetical protein
VHHLKIDGGHLDVQDIMLSGGSDAAIIPIGEAAELSYPRVEQDLVSEK